MRLAIALDFPNAQQALTWVRRHLVQLPIELREKLVLKVGLELFIAEGPVILEQLEPLGFSIFLDLKLFDIPNTVQKAVSSAGKLGVHFLTVHLGGGLEMLQAAKASADQFERLNLVGVTVLTSWSDTTLLQVGCAHSVDTQVLRLAGLAETAKLNWLVSSAAELSILASTYPQMSLVTPGIRLAGEANHDQVRVITPEIAKSNGSKMLVMGRSITESKVPEQIIREVVSQ